MDKDIIRKFAKTTLEVVKKCIDNDIEFGNWGHIMYNKKTANEICDILGIKNWFAFCQQNKSSEYFYDLFLTIDDPILRNFAITRFIKTRASDSDEYYFDSIGCKKNIDNKDKKWDNDVFGYKLDLKSTYLHGEYNTIEKVENDPIGFIKYTYGISSGSKDGSERADIGFLNDRFFIISHSLREDKNKFLVESGYKGRYAIFDSLVNEFSDSNVFKIQVFNNSDDKKYLINSVILIIYEDENGNIAHKLLKSTN